MKVRPHLFLKSTRIILSIFILFFIISCRENVSLNSPDGMIIILKADDMGDTTANWNRFVKILIDDSINAGIGIISKNVHMSSVPEIQRVSDMKQKNGFPVVEFWNHGYDHVDLKEHDQVTEFYNTNYAYQHAHFELAQRFFSDTLHFTSHSFGAPHNRTTLLTETVVESFKEINIWQHYTKIEKYKHTGWKDPKFKVIGELDKHIILSIDYLSLKYLDIETMIKNYELDCKKPYLLIQIHPAGWDDEIFDKFKSLIQFYKQNHRAIFMTPYQYYQYLHKNSNIKDIK